MDTTTYNELISYLTTLKLSHIRKNLDDFLKVAEAKGLSYLELLWGLIQCELKGREESGLKRRIKAANFPAKKTLEEFDFAFQMSVKPERLLNLAESRWTSRATNLLFLGPTGVGKTHLSIALGIEAIKRGYDVYFITVQEMVDKFYAAMATGELNKLLKRLLRYDCIIIDELGYLPLDQTASNCLFQLVSQAYEKRSLIVTSNKGFEGWGEIFHDTVIATAILDRLLHHSEIFSLSGESYRIKDKLKHKSEESL